ncbi:hypothetical protein BDF20DRAFT_866808 [Mycotypha africana]|uniref:uncharacterized protein n=1 Tax=Mycotypha africana TaxID=64632 RepID=UPI002301FCA8|nr:uncharacterized protein BDF20DRAFT_866808 [Mycotypha africana]KAI8982415.1 hypothetical protein BDF20DRAFT_866808 [Mycotypha africana]
MTSLVDYTSSSSEDEVEIAPKRETADRKRKASASKDTTTSNKMPKLPAFFSPTSTVSSASSMTSQKKDLKGRIRTVPHIADSWATYVYCKVDLSSEMKTLSPHLLHSEGVVLIEEQHISLSRPVYLKKFQLDSFAKDVRDTFSGQTPFHVSFAQAATLVNDEKTRAFYTLEIGKGYNELYSCMQSIDRVMNKYRLPVFYDPPRFHTSIAWALSEKTIASIRIPTFLLDPIVKDEYLITKVYLKMGNKLETIELT